MVKWDEGYASPWSAACLEPRPGCQLGRRCNAATGRHSVALVVRITTGIQLQGPEGAQRPRALSAAMA